MYTLYDSASYTLPQVKAASDRVDSDLHEMSKPLTRGVEDEDRENHLKDIEHADDPMLAYMRSSSALYLLPSFYLLLSLAHCYCFLLAPLSLGSFLCITDDSQEEEIQVGG